MARKQIAHGRLSFCASRAYWPHCTRRSGHSVTDSQLSRHRRAVSVCGTFPGFDRSRKCSFHGQVAYIRRSTHTWPVRMCQQCSASTVPLLISHRPASQPLLRHIRPGLCVLLRMRWDIGTQADSTQEAVLLCLSCVWTSLHSPIRP